MVSLSELPSTITNAAKTVLDAVGNLNDLSKNSLTAYARPTTIVSRVYIDGLVYQESVISSVLKAIHTLYASFIINALQMNRLVTESKTVRDMLNIVSNESVYRDIASDFELFGTKASLEGHPLREQLAADKDRESDRNNTSGELVSLADGSTPTGKLIKVTLTNPKNKEASITLNLLVQLAPYKVPEEYAYKLITMDALPSIFHRFYQWQAGEISFWRDFIFQMDIVNERRKALFNDKDGVLSDYLEKQGENKIKLWDNISKDPNDRKRNLASTVLIMSTQSILRAKIETGIDFNDKADRERFFINSLAMMVVVIDTSYNHITMYFNGMDEVGTYTFDQFIAASKKGDSALDLISALSSFAKGNTPRF